MSQHAVITKNVFILLAITVAIAVISLIFTVNAQLQMSSLTQTYPHAQFMSDPFTVGMESQGTNPNMMQNNMNMGMMMDQQMMQEMNEMMRSCMQMMDVG